MKTKIVMLSLGLAMTTWVPVAVAGPVDRRLAEIAYYKGDFVKVSQAIAQDLVTYEPYYLLSRQLSNALKEDLPVEDDCRLKSVTAKGKLSLMYFDELSKLKEARRMRSALGRSYMNQILMENSMKNFSNKNKFDEMYENLKTIAQSVSEAKTDVQAADAEVIYSQIRMRVLEVLLIRNFDAQEEPGHQYKGLWAVAPDISLVDVNVDLCGMWLDR